jgi:aryl-alcohol dehydrogenase-like predicted oxidoreductase
MFGEVDYDPTYAYGSVPLEEQLACLADAVEAGKVRYVGISNETPWGLMRCCHLGAVKALKVGKALNPKPGCVA